MMGLTLAIKISNSLNQFIDTNVVLRYANGEASAELQDVEQILREAVGPNRKRQLWISSVLFAELRPSNFKPGAFASLDELSKYIRSFADVVSPDPPTMMRAARLRDLRWQRKNKAETEKPRTITLGDAIHLASALWVKEALKVADLEFLTFDNGRSSTDETEPGTKSLSLLKLEDYTDGLGNNPDVTAAVLLRRVPPIVSTQSRLDLR